MRVGQEFEEDLDELLDELEQHEEISLKNLDVTKWKNIEDWTNDDVEDANRRIRADTKWYKDYNDRLERVMLRENIDNILLHLLRLEEWNQQLLQQNTTATEGISEWAIEELNHRRSCAKDKVMSEHALLKEAVASTIDSFDDEELSNLKNHTYIQSCSNKSIELLCITDSLTGRLASEIVYIGNLRDRIDETKENLKNRTSFL